MMSKEQKPSPNIMTLGDCCEYLTSRSDSYNYVGTENMLQNGAGVSIDSHIKVRGITYASGDVLMSNIRPYLKKVWKADREGTCSSDVLAIRATNIEPGYLSYLLLSDKTTKYIMSAAKGTKMPRGDKQHLMQMPIVLPSLPEQERIASLLSAVDSVIDACRAEVDAYSELSRTMSHDLLLGKRRFKDADGNPYPDWETRTFSELYDESTERNGDNRLTMDSFISVASMTYKQLADKELPAESSVKSYKVVRLGDIAFEGHRNKRFSHGRFVLNDAGVGLVSSIFKCFRPKPGWEDSNDLRFWKHYIHSEDVMHDVTRMSTNAGVMMDSLVPADFLRQSVPVPCLAEQRRIGEALDAVGSALEASRGVLAGYEELKRSLLSELFA